MRWTDIISESPDKITSVNALDIIINEAKAMDDTDYGYWITDVGGIITVPSELGHQKVACDNGSSFGHALDDGWIRIVISDDNSLHVQINGGRVGARAILGFKTLKSSHFPKIYADVQGSMSRSDKFDNPTDVVRLLNRTSRAAVETYTHEDWKWANSG